jgi:hypothetical protein
MAESKVTVADFIKRGHQAMLDYQALRAKFSERMTESRCWHSDYFDITYCAWCKTRPEGYQYTEEDVKQCAEKGSDWCNLQMQAYLKNLNINQTDCSFSGDYLKQLVELSNYVFPIWNNYDPYQENTMIFVFFAPMSVAKKITINFNEQYIYMIHDFRTKIRLSNWAEQEHPNFGGYVATWARMKSGVIEARFPKQWREEMNKLFEQEDSLTYVILEDPQEKRKDLFQVLLKYFQENHEDYTKSKS